MSVLWLLSVTPFLIAILLRFAILDPAIAQAVSCAQTFV